jgi:hypothetical protein
VAVVIGAVLLALLVAWIRFRIWWVKLRAPNGALDGRRNVRVRGPGDERDVV